MTSTPNEESDDLDATIDVESDSADVGTFEAIDRLLIDMLQDMRLAELLLDLQPRF